MFSIWRISIGLLEKNQLADTHEDLCTCILFFSEVWCEVQLQVHYTLHYRP